MIVKLLLLNAFIFRYSVCENNENEQSYYEKYCIHPDCSLDNQHTMCVTNNKHNARLLVAGLTPWMRYQLLLLHNKHRDNIAVGLEAGQPKATNMRKMYWDYELEEVAEAWARQCQKRHDECRNTLRFNVAQNMDVRPVGQQVTEAQLLSDAVGSWFSGSRALPSDHVYSFRLANCSAPGGCNANWYSAATWASTWRIGCSQALCTTKRKPCDQRKIRSFRETSGFANETILSTTENILRRTKYFKPTTVKIDNYDTTVRRESRESLLHRGTNVADKKSKRADVKIVAYTFCNYGPAGNIEGFPIYEVGNTCGNCPQGTTCLDQTHRGLCSVIGDPDTRT